MKPNLKFFALLALPIIFSKCTEDDNNPQTEPNYLTIANQEYELTNGTMVYIEEVMYNEDPDLKYTIDLIFYTEGISVEETGQVINFAGQGQRIGISFATNSKTDLYEGTFDLNSPNVQHVGYYSDWREDRDAADQNPYNTLTAAEISISKTGDIYQIALTGTDEQSNSIAVQYEGNLAYFSLE